LCFEKNLTFDHFVIGEEQIGLTPEEVVGKILASPDIAASLQNPKVMEAIMDVSSDLEPVEMHTLLPSH
jgi:hypothetical protein